MIQETNNAVIMEPDQAPHSCIIWLHGLGANGHDFVPVVEELRLTRQGTRVILPHAPEMPVSINGGAVMPSWYDIKESELNTNTEKETIPAKEMDLAGITQSANRIKTLFDEQIAFGIKPDRLVLAGFSQGGAMALYTGFRLPYPLAGIMSLSGYLMLASIFSEELNPDCVNTPVFVGHGDYDPVVPPAASEQIEISLKSHGMTVETHHYPMEHSVSMDEIADIGLWLKKVLE